MLKRSNRIRLNKDFDYAFKNSQSFYNNVFGLKKAKNNLDIFRFGTLINLKVSKKAVERNKIKRQLREIIREELPKLKGGNDLVLIALPPIASKDFSEIKQLLLEGLKKLKLYK